MRDLVNNNTVRIEKKIYNSSFLYCQRIWPLSMKIVGAGLMTFYIFTQKS